MDELKGFVDSGRVNNRMFKVGIEGIEGIEEELAVRLVDRGRVIREN